MFKDGDRICFFGDSITANGIWMSEVYQILRKKYKLKCFNCAVSGATATQGADYLYGECLIYNPTHVFVMYGMNDFGLWLYAKDSESIENLEEQRMERIRLHKENYEAVIKAIKDFGCEVIIGLPTPYDEKSHVETESVPYQALLEMGAEYQLEIAKKYDCKVINFKDILKPIIEERHIISEDRVHPNEEGYHIMAQIFLKELGEIHETDFDTPFEYEAWNKERFDIEFNELKGLNYVELCVGYKDGKERRTPEELKEFVKADYETKEDKECFVAKAYSDFLDHGEKRNWIRGEVIKRTI